MIVLQIESKYTRQAYSIRLKLIRVRIPGNFKRRFSVSKIYILAALWSDFHPLRPKKGELSLVD